MKRKVLLLLVLVTLVAGGAFAQRVGDTLDAFGKNYTVQEAKDGRVILQLTPTLDGTWKSEGGTVVTFNGNTAVYKQFSSTGYVQSAVKKGLIKNGDQAFRNFSKTGALTWSGQSRIFQFNTDAPDVCTGINWSNCTITISADGKTFQYYLAGATVNQYTTYTRQ
jgi:hypothetical protein